VEFINNSTITYQSMRRTFLKTLAD